MSGKSRSTSRIDMGPPKTIFPKINNDDIFIDGQWYRHPAPTMSVTPSLTPTITPTMSMTPTMTPSVTPTLTPTMTSSVSPSITPSITPTVTATPSMTPSISPSISPSITPSITPTVTATPSMTPSISPSVTPTITPSITVTPTATPTVTPTIAPSPSNVPAICSSTVLQAPFNGINNGTSFHDQAGRTLTGSGIITSTAESKFNGSSAYFPGTSLTTYIETDSGSTWADFTNQNFTIEGWVKTSQNNQQHTCLMAYGISAWNGYGSYAQGYNMYAINFNADSSSDGKIEFCLSNISGVIGTSQMVKSLGVITNNIWNHVAVVRSSGSWYIFINGVKSGERLGVSTNQVGSIPAGNKMRFGNNYGANQGFNGYLQDWRIIKGQAIYTTDFAPPSAPFVPCV